MRRGETQMNRNISPRKFNFSMAKWAKDWRLLLLVLIPLFLIFFLSVATPFNPISTSAIAPLGSFFLPNRTIFVSMAETSRRRTRCPLDGARIAVCLVGGARRFELTGPSIVKNILEVYPDADLFLHSPYDKKSFKFLLLNAAPRIAWVRIFEPKPMPESESQLRVLTASNSPNGIQGLLQYFNLVEGCLTMIKTHQQRNNFTYNWIIRTRVDSYWNAPLNPDHFIPGKYIVPSGSSYGGLNDRLGIGDFATSEVALSRLALIPHLDLSGLHQLNSETSFRAQLTTQNVTYATHRLPFCIVSDRQYVFPPKRYDVPVAAMSSLGPLSGAKCRPCKATCKSKCVADVMPGLNRGWSWTDWENGSLELCDARGEWEKGWEKIFDRTAGPNLGNSRKKVWSMKMKQCVAEFEKMRRRSKNWEAPAAEEICKLGLA